MGHKLYKTAFGMRKLVADVPHAGYPLMISEGEVEKALVKMRKRLRNLVRRKDNGMLSFRGLNRLTYIRYGINKMGG